MAGSIATPSTIPLAYIRATPTRPRGIVARETARLLSSVAIAVFALYAAAYVLRVVGLLAYPFDLDQGEGYDVNSGWLILRGAWIYTSNETWPYYSSNYPPLYSLLLAPLLSAMGPTLAAGRLLSAGATVALAVLIGVAVRGQRGSAVSAVLAALIFLASPYVYHATPLARVNALAEMLTLGGLLLAFRGGRRSIPLGLIVLALAVWTKPTAAPAVMAGLAFAVVARPRVGLVAASVVGTISVLLLVALEEFSGGAFLLNVVQGNVNPWSAHQAGTYWTNFAVIHAGVLALAGWALYRRCGGPFWLASLAALPTAIGVGKWGAGESYFLALIVATSVLAGCALSRLSRPVELTAASLVILIQAGLFLHEPFVPASWGWHDLGLQQASLGGTPDAFAAEAGWEVVDIVNAVAGPVLAEDASFALLAGREVVGNATHLRNLHQSGLWSGERLLEDIEERRFRWIILDAQLYPEPVLERIGSSYYLYTTVLVHDVEQWIFAPGTEGPRSEGSL